MRTVLSNDHRLASPFIHILDSGALLQRSGLGSWSF